MPYNPRKNGAANYKSWMQLTASQITTIEGIEGADNTSDPNSERFAQMVYVVNSSDIGTGSDTYYINAVAETGTPTPVTDGADVAPWYDEYGRQVIAGYNPIQGAIDVNLINDSTISRLGPETNLDAESTPTIGAWVDVGQYKNITIHILSTDGGSGVSGTVTVEHSLDNVNYVILDTLPITTADTFQYEYANVAYKYIRTSLTVAANGTFDSIIYAGN